MQVSNPTRPAVLVIIALVPLLCFAQSGSLTLDQVVSRMQQARAAQRANGPAYVVTREYQLAPAGASQPASEVVAEVSYMPPSQKQYVIVKSEGNERGTGIVRKVLEHETTMAGKWEPHDISPANYDFALLGHEALDGHDCIVLQLSPKREAVELVKGKAWVDARNFGIRRIEGITAKSPSFWIKQLQVRMDFGDVNGVWLEKATKAVADVRLAGTHVLTSREVDVRTGTVDARLSKPHAARNNGRTIVADTATWVAH